MDDCVRDLLDLDMSPQQVAGDFGLDIRTAKDLLKQPHNKRYRSVLEKIERGLRQKKPTLASDLANRIYLNYREHKKADQLHKLPQFIEDHFVYLDRFEPESEFERAELMYIRGHLHYSRAFHVRGSSLDRHFRCSSAKLAIELYQGAAHVLKALDPSALTAEQRKRQHKLVELFQLNADETFWQMAKQGYAKLQEAVAWLREHDVLRRLQRSLADNPAIWTIAHNGLRFASQLQDVPFMKFFLEKLVDAEPGFKDWDFASGETPSLNEDDDLVFFRSVFRPSTRN